MDNQRKINTLKNAIESLRFGEHISNLCIVLYTDCVNFTTEELTEIFEYYKYTPWFNAFFCIPNDVYYELSFMSKYSKITKFKKNALLILNHCQKQDWNLEDFYEKYADCPPHTLHTCLFVFSVYSIKQQEFISNTFRKTKHLVCYFNYSNKGKCFVCSTTLIDNAKSDTALHVQKITINNESFSENNDLTFEFNDSSTVNIPYKELIPTRKGGREAALFECGDNRFKNKYIKIYTPKRKPYIPDRVVSSDIKIYNIASGAKLKKLKFLQSFGRFHPDIDVAFPETIAYIDDRLTKSIGFSMKKTPGETLNDILFFRPEDLTYQQKRLQYDKYVKKIFSILLDLHCFQIFASDISGNNIMINEVTDELCFVDCDSFQTLDIPGGGFTPQFKHKDIGDPNCTLRYPLHEDFALTILLYKMFVWEDVFISTELDYKFSWEKDTFQFDYPNNYVNLECSQSIVNAWSDLDNRLKALFADELHFRKSFSIGSWIKALDFDK